MHNNHNFLVVNISFCINCFALHKDGEPDSAEPIVVSRVVQMDLKRLYQEGGRERAINLLNAQSLVINFTAGFRVQNSTILFIDALLFIEHDVNG